MENPRPASITVVAIFHFIFGGLGLLCGLCQGGAVMLLFAAEGAQAQAGAQGGPFSAEQNQFNQEVIKTIKARAPWFLTYKLLEQVINIVFSVMLIVAGVGLLRMGSWARWLSVAYA